MRTNKLVLVHRSILFTDMFEDPWTWKASARVQLCLTSVAIWSMNSRAWVSAIIFDSRWNTAGVMIAFKLRNFGSSGVWHTHRKSARRYFMSGSFHRLGVQTDRVVDLYLKTVLSFHKKICFGLLWGANWRSQQDLARMNAATKYWYLVWRASEYYLNNGLSVSHFSLSDYNDNFLYKTR